MSVYSDAERDDILDRLAVATGERVGDQFIRARWDESQAEALPTEREAQDRHTLDPIQEFEYRHIAKLMQETRAIYRDTPRMERFFLLHACGGNRVDLRHGQVFDTEYLLPDHLRGVGWGEIVKAAR